jgi:hypothetical protein
MYIVGKDPLVFLNPLQVESIRYDEEKLVLNADQSGQARAIIKMASGEEFVIDHNAARGTSIDEAIKKLVFQIDLANGLKIESSAKEEAKAAKENADD